MLKIRIIPCLDVKDGRVVKGINFLNLKDAGDPVEQAHYYSTNGADEICFLDINASIENRSTMIGIVKKTAEKVFIPLTVGGGVSSLIDIRNLLNAGADKVSINDWIVYSQGGTKKTDINAIIWMKRLEDLGAGEILLTSMDKDGTKNGFDLELLKKASDELSIPIIASGGVGKLRHFKDGVTIGKANALLAASVFHFGEVSIQNVKDYLRKAGVNVRIDQ